MAFGRKRYGKTYRKRGYKRSNRTVGSYIGKGIDAISGYGLKLLKSKLGLNTETHWFDTVETNTATSATASLMTNPLVIPIGDTVNTRSGNSVRLVSLSCHGRIMANTAATTTCLVRVLFIHFKENRGVTFSNSTILDDTSRITTHYNMGDSAAATNYTVLYDRTFTIPLSNDPGSAKVFNIMYTPVSHHLKWDSSDTTGAAASLQTGLVRGLIMTSETGANTPNYWADWRVRFVDN